MNDTIDNNIFNKDILKNPPITDGSKKVDDGILEILGHYTLDELKKDHAKVIKEGNTRKEVILDYVLDRLFQRESHIDRIMVSTYNNFATFSVGLKDGYTLQMSIEDCNKAIKDGRNPRLGKLNLESMEIE
jgi:hypothetical protein